MKYALFGNVENINAPFVRDDINPDVVFSFGGDGTMLGAIHKYKDSLDKVKFIGVNTGRLGFYNDYKIDELEYIYDILQSNDYDEASYSLLEYSIKNSKIEYKGIAVNDLAITNPIHTQIIEIYINNKCFETFRGTGFLISPPTGSTAYNKSLGGSVIDPNIKSIQLTEIAPINNRVYKVLGSPIVLSEKSKLKLVIKESENIFLSVDGVHLDIDDICEINASISESVVSFIVRKNTDFFDRVKRSFIDE